MSQYNENRTFFSCALLLCLLLAGYQKPQPGVPPFGQASFADYQQQTRAWVATHRAFQSADRETELVWNTPQEWRPEGNTRKGILLIYGLGDAPGSFTDLGPALAHQGLLVRTVLLAGHGTRREDMLSISVNDWRQTVTEQAAILAREVDALSCAAEPAG